MKEGKRPVTKLHMTGTVMWKKRELGENIENKGAPREQSEPPGKRKSMMSSPCSQASPVLTDTTVVGVGGGWEDTGADAPNAGQFLRRHHILANAIIDTVQMSLCYMRRPDTLLFPVTLRAPKAANPSAGLFPNSQVSYRFFQSLLLISRSKSRGPSKLGKTELLFPSESAQGRASQPWLVFALYMESLGATL